VSRNPQSAPPRGTWLSLAIVLAAATLAASLAAATPRSGRELRDALARTPDATRGVTLFDTCAACHGRSGEGATDGTVPAIGGQHYEAVVSALVAFRSQGRSDVRMEHFADPRHLEGAQDIADVAAAVARLPRTASPGIGDGRHLARGTALYFRACAGCHGPSGQGNAAQRVPRLGGQHFAYLLRQLEDTQASRRANMLPDHARLLTRPQASAEELAGVADYLSRLGIGR
jgi:cytochrome c553